MEKNVYLVDGKINPCDTDYKSFLSVGNFKELGISKVGNQIFIKVIEKIIKLETEKF